MTYIVRLGSFDGDGAYFRGTLDGEDIVSSYSQSHAMRFRDKGLAELAAVQIGDARVVRLRKASLRHSASESKGKP